MNETKKKKNINVFGFIQKLGKSLMLPIAVLPAAAIFLRLGQADLLNVPVITAVGSAVFENMALLFALGVAIGFASDGHGAAAIAGAISFFMINYITAAINTEIKMGVFAGIIGGIIGGNTYNRFKDIKLPDFLAFFGGRRFVPIVTGAITLVVGVLLSFIWPPIQNALNVSGAWMTESTVAGPFAFGFANRMLIPTGLHHVINTMVWQVFGEFAGKTGDLNRFFAGDPAAGTFMTGFFPVMMFGLPAAALAMYHSAKPQNKAAVAGALFSVGFTAFLTGITEPLEFMFMFLSPILYFFHALLTGASMALMNILGAKSGFGFSGSALDLALNWGISTKPILIIVVGIIMAFIYYFLFRFLIVKFNLSTPGREEDETAQGVSDIIQSEGIDNVAQKYVQALGGKQNIADIDSCITRLRISVNDIAQVDEAKLKALGCAGIIKKGNSLQIVIGTQVEHLFEKMKKFIF